ncbi:MAG TPA: restriction endonuclease subunit S [Dissulfurispiraceae bacterium]|nr:restriction endonuclease subunit S [Dissulfurispiraceae bacterium]
MSLCQDKLWEYITVAEAVHIISTNEKKIRQKEYLTVGDFPVIDQGQDYIGGYTNDGSKLITCERPVIVFGDHTKTVKYINKPFVPGADGVKVLEPHEYFDAKLFEYFLRYLAVKLPSKGYARHYQHLSKSCIPLPPLNEQKRIVAKIEELFSELDKGIESLKTAREQLKVYRQALLKHAFEGKLTAQWREENKDKLEIADALLKRIQTERKQRYQQQLKEWQKALKKWEAGGKKDKKPTKPSQPKHQPPLAPEELADLPQLPAGWAWGHLSFISENIQIGPFGSLLHKEDYISGGIPLINPSHIKRSRIVPDHALSITAKKMKELANYSLKLNDIVMGRRGEMGRCAVVGQTEAGWLCGTGSLIVRLLPSMKADYYCQIISSQRVKHYLSSASIGTTMQNLNEKVLHTVPVPICGSEEQKEICSQIEKQDSEIDQLEQTIEQAHQQSEALRQSILKKAFSGQLVPQDPKDEPASVLLERIRAERKKETKKAGLKTARRGKV